MVTCTRQLILQCVLIFCSVSCVLLIIDAFVFALHILYLPVIIYTYAVCIVVAPYLRQHRQMTAAPTPHIMPALTDSTAIVSLIIDEEMVANMSCVICLLPYSVGDEAGLLNCGHIYHLECIKKWLDTGPVVKCPMGCH